MNVITRLREYARRSVKYLALSARLCAVCRFFIEELLVSKSEDFKYKKPSCTSFKAKKKEIDIYASN